MISSSTMSISDIHKNSLRRFKKNAGSVIPFTFFSICTWVFLMLCDMIIFYILKKTGFGWLYTFSGLKADKSGWIFWIIKVLLLIILLLPETAVFRRLFMDMISDGKIADTRMYISAHSGKFYGRALYYSFIPKMIKFFALIPALVSGYGVYYWGLKNKINELTSLRLFGFMLCLGITLVWVGVWIHYCISLALTPYIMALNPRSDIFDACDLSVKLMEGMHLKYISFLASFVKFLPLIILVYPVFAIYPYFKVCYVTFMEDILGDYRRDKMPGMVKRWKKYLG